MNLSRLIALAISAGAFVVYCLTLAPGVGFIDSGELAAVASTLGIAHPTGYALFTLVGWLVAHAPLPGSVILRLNVFAALCCTAGVFVFYHVARRILLLSTGRGEDPARSIPAAAAASLLMAFSETWWSQAVAVEVYPLHILFLCVILFTFLRANAPLPGEEESDVWWYVFAFLVGLSFTNHMTTILLAPGLIFLFFMRQGSTIASWRLLIRMILPFAAGLSVVLYIPLRAAHHPLLNWGDPSGFERFFWHVTGKQYRVWIFSSGEAAERQIAYFLRSYPPEFAFVGLLAAIPGFAVLWSWNRQLAFGALLLFVVCVLYAINYDIHDIDSYFLLAYVVTALWAGVGMHALWKSIAGTSGLRAAVATILLLCAGAAPLLVNYRSVDRSTDHLVDDYTANMLASLDSNAVILSFQWDYWIAASYYAQLVEGVRPDVIVIDKELLRRSWYVRELGRRYPWLLAGAQKEIDAFLTSVSRFEHDLPYDGGTIEARYAGMIGAIIRTSIATRPVYVTAEMQVEYTRGYWRVPSGLAFRLMENDRFLPTPSPHYFYRPFLSGGRLERTVPRLYAESLAARGEYYLVAGKDRAEASKCLEKAMEFDPSSPVVQRFAGILRTSR